MDDLIELVREELRLRHEIAAHELSCLADDGAPDDELDAKLRECEMIIAQREDLERRIPRLTAGS